MSEIYNSREKFRMRTSKTDPIPRWMLRPRAGDDRIFISVGLEQPLYRDDDNVILNYKSTQGGYIVEDAYYKYEDTLRENLGTEVMDLSAKMAFDEVGNDDTAEYFEAMLRNALNDPTIQLNHMLVTISDNKGESIQVFGFYSEIDYRKK